MPKLKKKSAAQKRQAKKTAMSKLRENEEIKDKLRKIDRASKSIKRLDDEIRLANLELSRQCQRKRLSDVSNRLKHLERLKICRIKRLTDPDKRLEECEMKKLSQIKRLADPRKRLEQREREKLSQRKRLADPEKRVEQQEREKLCQAKRLTDPMRRKEHRMRDKASHFRRLLDPNRRQEQREREKVSQKKRLAKPENRQVHLLREKESQKKRLAKPENRQVHLLREKESQKKRLAKPENRQVHLLREKESQKKRLANPEKRELHLNRQKAAQKARLSNPEKRIQHRQRDKESHKVARQDITKKFIHRERLKIAQINRLLNPENLKKHRQKLRIMQQRRLSLDENRRKQNERNLACYYNRQDLQMSAKKMSLIESYKNDIKDGPFWVCACCDRLWFRHSVKHYSVEDLASSKISFEFISQCCPGIISTTQVGFLCLSCKRNITANKIPRLSLYYKELAFPEIPPALRALTQLEERFLAPRIPFMQIFSLRKSHQFSVKGRVVNVPTEVPRSIEVLPRLPSETDMIPVALKKKKTFKSNYLFENVRPNIIHNALRFLKDCPVYKEAGVKIDLSRVQRNDPHQFSFVENEINEEDRGQNETMDSSDSETDEQPFNIPDNETVLLSEALVFAPGEDFTPLPLFLDTHAEAMSFIKIYAGQLRIIPQHLSYQDWVKSETMRADRRCASIPKLFYSSIKLRALKIASSIGFCLRKTKGAPCLSAQQALCDDFRNKLAIHDSGFKLFTPDRGSPAFWEEKKREVFAMIRQLGPPTFFITLSPAETKWPELLVILKKVVDKENITETEALNMTYEEKARLIKEDPVTCAKYFEYRSNKLLSLIKSKNIFFEDHHVIDSYFRVEFQQRGSPHLHGLIWLHGAPHYEEGNAENNQLCAKFIDRFITCSSSVLPEELIQFQRHKHTFTCRRKTHKSKKCRFGIPFYPMMETVVLEPLSESDLIQNTEVLKKNVKAIKCILETFYKDGTDIKFEDFLQKLSMSVEDYIFTVRSTIKRPTVFLKRSPCDVKINNFNSEILELHNANMDLQFITDTWSCAMYVLNYINKSKRGISRLLQDAIKEVKHGNLSIREQLRSMGNKFLNASEFSAQEAVYYVLGMSLSMSSRSCVFINTGRPESRVLVLKSKEVLKNLPSDSTDIFHKNVLDHYIQRPACLDSMCLAEFAAYYQYSSFSKSKTNLEYDGELSDPLESQTLDQWLHLKDKSGYIAKRQKAKVIRYTRFKIENDEANYFREQLMLFSPWRNEENELLNVNTREKFINSKDILLENRAKFIYSSGGNDFEDIIEKAIRDHENWDNDPDDDNSETEETGKNEFEVLRDRTDEGDILVDMGHALGNKSIADITFPVPHLVNEDQYHELVRSLNDKQRRYLMHLLHSIKTGKSPIYECILGGAGVGKSRLIETIHQTVLRHLNKLEGARLDTIKVLLCAPTGKAAYAIKGITLHSAFALPLNQFSHGLPPLSSSVSNTLFSQLHQLKLIIMDEVSMIGSKVLSQIDERLKQIFRSNLPFAGRSILLFGDFNQLAPVGDRYIFQPDLSNPYGELIGNPLWDMFTFFKLTEIMRQKNDALFATALNNLAIGSLSPEEVELFKSRIVSQSHLIPSNALRLYRTNAEVNSFNESIFEGCTNVIIVNAVDRVIGNVSNTVKEKLLKSVEIAALHKTYSLPTSLKLAVGIHYMVTNNISVVDGIVNGAVGVLKYIELNAHKEVVRLWLYFNEQQVGKECRGAFANIAKSLQLKNNWTPISKVTRNIKPWDSSPALVCRQQFPVVPAEAITIHKSQGGTYETVVVNIKKGMRRNELYVAFSRATKLSGLYLIGNFKPPPPPQEGDLVLSTIKNALEMKPIRFSVPFIQDFSGLSIICHNVQSLNFHFHDIIADRCFLSASVMIFLETWSKEKDYFDFPSFVQVHRIDVQRSHSHAYGLLVFCKEDLKSKIKVITHFNCEDKNKMFNLVLLKLEDMYICAGYKPPSTPFKVIEEPLNVCFQIVSQSDIHNIILLGDFNVNLLKPVPQIFSKLLSENNIVNKIVNTPSTDGLTQLDVCFSNISHLEASYYESYFSYHKPIVCLIPQNSPSTSVTNNSDNIEEDFAKMTQVSFPGYPHIDSPRLPSTSQAADDAGFPIPTIPDRTSLPLPPGFANKDNVSCYANSICQALLSLDEVHKAILCANEQNEITSLIRAYRAGLNELNSLNLRKEVALKTDSLQFIRNEQQDAVEFFTHLAYAVPAIEKVFSHKLLIEYRCKSCGYSSQQYQTNLVLSVTVHDNEASIASMIASDYGFWKPVEGSCSYCDSRNSFESKTSVIVMPDCPSVLVIQLVLFERTSHGSLIKKNCVLNNIGTENIIISGQKYIVSAIISHHGVGIDSGHYTSLINRKDTWIKANDSKVAYCELPREMNDAYLIFLAKE